MEIILWDGFQNEAERYAFDFGLGKLRNFSPTEAEKISSTLGKT